MLPLRQYNTNVGLPPSKIKPLDMDRTAYNAFSVLWYKRIKIMLVERTPNFEFLPIVVVNVGLTLLNNDGMLRYIHVVIKSVDVTSDIVRSH